MTKQEILDRFSDIDFAYNDSSKHETLSRMLDELLKEQEHKDRMYHALEDDWKRLKELLKEQEAVKPTWGRGKPFCGACGLRIRGGKFCSECGKPIAWEGR